MQIKAQNNDLRLYLTSSEIIDFNSKTHDSIRNLADEIEKISANKIDYIKNVYEYVRDKISHSADIKEDAAILRYKGIPAGLCYQKLILDDETAPLLVYHGLNGVYIDEYDKWIRLDARGNKNGIKSEFSINEEQLAFFVRSEKGEFDVPIIFNKPDKKIIEVFTRNKTRAELWNNIPNELDEYIAICLCIFSQSTVSLLGQCCVKLL